MKTRVGLKYFVNYCSLLFCCGNIEKNLGLFVVGIKKGLTTHDSIKIFLLQLQAYITQHNYDIICLSETFLISSSDSSNNRMPIDGYS